MNHLLTINPLPQALAHYQRALAETLGQVGWRSVSIEASSAEAPKSRIATAARLGHSRFCLDSDERHLSLWPALGWLDLLKRADSRLAVVVHDPEPIRRQALSGARLGQAVMALPPRYRAEVVVHSAAAASAVRRLGARDVTCLPHPILKPSSRAQDPADSILRVLGSFKPTRDTALLEMIARALPGWQCEILGRGWPPVPGWAVVNRHLQEAELDDLVDGATAVLIPYRKYFQSGIALRALERGTPVVGRAESYLAEVLGRDYTGLAENDADWVAAISRAAEGAPELRQRISNYEQASLAAWRNWLERPA